MHRPALRTLVPLIAGVLCACAGVATRPGPSVTGPALRVATFNVRYGTAEDGANAWPRRRDLVMDVIRHMDPDVMGVQEALRFQLDELSDAFPHMGQLGVGRDDGAEAGEYSAILYDRRRLEPLDGGTFWLSDTPEVPGSATWGNRIPRIVTWARFRERRTGRGFYVYNTHWDHESQPSRERSAELLLQRVARRSAPDPFLILGDFNAGEANPAYRNLLAGSPSIGPLVDPFRILHPDASSVGTFHGFTGDGTGERIDAVLASPGWEVLQARIERWHVAGPLGARYPSDHFPVLAVLRLPAEDQVSGNTLGSTSSTTTISTNAMGSPTLR